MGRSIEVLRAGAGLAPVLAHRIMVPASVHGEAITPDGRYLLAASGNGAVVVRVSGAEHGRAGSVLGMLTSPGGAGAVEVALSRDGRFAFVTQETGSGTLAVFNRTSALASGLRESGFVGDVRLRRSPPIGISLSGNGQWLYVTTQKRDSQAGPGHAQRDQRERAESHPAGAVPRLTVPAVSHPGRVITTSGGLHGVGHRPGQQRAAGVLGRAAAQRPGPGPDREGPGRPGADRAHRAARRPPCLPGRQLRHAPADIQPAWR